MFQEACPLGDRKAFSPTLAATEDVACINNADSFSLPRRFVAESRRALRSLNVKTPFVKSSVNYPFPVSSRGVASIEDAPQ